MRTNVRVAVQYLESWLRGLGCVPLYDLMEDAAAAEISRAQVWQWIQHPRGTLDDGRNVTVELFRRVLDEELAGIRDALGNDRYAGGEFERARDLLDEICTTGEFRSFLTLAAYQHI